MYLTSIGALVLVMASLVAALQLHLRRQSRSAALLMDWWVWWRVIVGAAIPERLDLIAIVVVVAIAWLIGLVVAEAGPLMAVGLFLYLGPRRGRNRPDRIPRGATRQAGARQAVTGVRRMDLLS